MAYNLLPKQYRPQKPLYVAYTTATIYLLLCVCLVMFMMMVQGKNAGKLKDITVKNNEASVVKANTSFAENELKNIVNQLNQDEEYNGMKRVETSYTMITQAYAFNYGDFIQQIGKITPMEVGIQTVLSEGREVSIIAEVVSKDFADLFESKLRELKKDDVNLFTSVTTVQTGEANSNQYKFICEKK